MEIANRNCLNCFHSILSDCSVNARKGKRLCLINFNPITKEGNKPEVDKNSGCIRHKFEFELQTTFTNEKTISVEENSKIEKITNQQLINATRE